jgi:hypothetical protein
MGDVMNSGIDRLTFMESKILELGKKQSEKGYQGGAFTPGFIRKETEYGYRAINVALESLIARGLVEKTVTSSFRDGGVVELDVYKITNKGLTVVSDIEAGNVQINGREPQTQPNVRPQERRPAYPKPWEAQQQGRRSEARPDNIELAQTVQGLERAVAAMSQDLKALHDKLDRLLASQAPAAPRAQAAPRAKRGGRQLSKEALFHRQLIIKAVTEAGKLHDVVLSEDVKSTYEEACAKAGVAPKKAAQFGTFLKRMQADGLLTLERKGCRALGIKGQGTRVAVALTGKR